MRAKTDTILPSWRIVVAGMIILLASTLTIDAQVLPVGTSALEDFYRREQLMGRVDPDISFSIRPLSNDALRRETLYDPDSSMVRFGHGTDTYFWAGDKGKVQLMPLSWQNRITTAYPYGMNDGPMIPAVGYQTMFSAGIYAQYKFLSIQFAPEFITAQNKAYTDLGPEHAVRTWSVWYKYANNIDMPVRFGDGAYTKAYLGQSSIRLNFDPVSFGLSTENLWWGPGMRSSLLMSNTAPGFLHATINTTRPVKTYIGSFEGQIVAGKLEKSGYLPRPLGQPEFSDRFYREKPDDWRYFSGMVITYQPKWLTGLSLGITRSFIVYRGDMGNKIGDYIPLFSSVTKEGVGNLEEDKRSRDQYASVFARWVLPAAMAEGYIEYGRNDHAYNLRDYIMQPDHSRAYVAGVRKLVELNSFNETMLQINAEVTKLDKPKAEMLRAGQTWYTHSQVRDGYTNRGQILGSGVGPGGVMQSLNVSWLRGFKQIGLQFERYVHNYDFYYDVSQDVRRNWIDISAALHGEWDYQNLIFNASIQYMNSLNYEYQLEEKPDAKDMWDFEHIDKKNFQINFGVLYRF